jgi:hypothetical protein
LRGWIAVALVAVFTVAALMPAGAQGTSQIIASGNSFYPGDDAITLELSGERVTLAIVEQGGELDLTNLDISAAAHSVTSDEYLPDQTPLFDSGALNFRQTAPVVGVEKLAPGTYAFHCRRHPSEMHGYFKVI